MIDQCPLCKLSLVYQTFDSLEQLTCTSKDHNFCWRLNKNQPPQAVHKEVIWLTTTSENSIWYCVESNRLILRVCSRIISDEIKPLSSLEELLQLYVSLQNSLTFL